MLTHKNHFFEVTAANFIWHFTLKKVVYHFHALVQIFFNPPIYDPLAFKQEFRGLQQFSFKVYESKLRIFRHFKFMIQPKSLNHGTIIPPLDQNTKFCDI